MPDAVPVEAAEKETTATEKRAKVSQRSDSRVKWWPFSRPRVLASPEPARSDLREVKAVSALEGCRDRSDAAATFS